MSGQDDTMGWTQHSRQDAAAASLFTAPVICARWAAAIRSAAFDYTPRRLKVEPPRISRLSVITGGGGKKTPLQFKALVINEYLLLFIEPKMNVAWSREPNRYEARERSAEELCFQSNSASHFIPQLGTTLFLRHFQEKSACDFCSRSTLEPADCHRAPPESFLFEASRWHFWFHEVKTRTARFMLK